MYARSPACARVPACEGRVPARSARPETPESIAPLSPPAIRVAVSGAPVSVPPHAVPFALAKRAITPREPRHHVRPSRFIARHAHHYPGSVPPTPRAPLGANWRAILPSLVPRSVRGVCVPAVTWRGTLFAGEIPRFRDREFRDECAGCAVIFFSGLHAAARNGKNLFFGKMRISF